MNAKYERLFSSTPNALGDPFPEIAGFFRSQAAPLDILDIGCGQGRDALFAARLGHRVTGVDNSPSGIAALTRAADAEGLGVKGIVADIATWHTRDSYDVLLIDRTLHMLPNSLRPEVLRRLMRNMRPGGTLLIADQRRNIPALREIMEQSGRVSKILKDAKGFLFARMLGAAKDTP